MDAAENGAAQHPPRKKRNRTAIVLGAFALIILICCVAVVAMWEDADFKDIRFGTRFHQLEGMEELIDEDSDQEEANDARRRASMDIADKLESLLASTRHYLRNGDDNLFWGIQMARIEYNFAYDRFIYGNVYTNSQASREQLYETLRKRRFRIWRFRGEEYNYSFWLRIPNLYFYMEHSDKSSGRSMLAIANMLVVLNALSLDQAGDL